MYVVKTSEITDSMYLIHTGKIEEISEESNKVPRIYPAGSYFGVVSSLFTLFFDCVALLLEIIKPPFYSLQQTT